MDTIENTPVNPTPDNSEDKAQKEKSLRFRRNMWIFVSIVLLTIVCWSFIYMFSNFKTVNQENEQLKADLNTLSFNLANKSRYSDSLFRVFMRYNKYRHAAESQSFRDSVERPLELKPGDIAVRKIDSARVLVTDVIFGGGLYDYYFRYRIMDSTGKEQEIRPELLNALKKKEP